MATAAVGQAPSQTPAARGRSQHDPADQKGGQFRCRTYQVRWDRALDDRGREVKVRRLVQRSDACSPVLVYQPLAGRRGGDPSDARVARQVILVGEEITDPVTGKLVRPLRIKQDHLLVLGDKSAWCPICQATRCGHLSRAAETLTTSLLRAPNPGEGMAKPEIEAEHKALTAELGTLDREREHDRDGETGKPYAGGLQPSGLSAEDELMRLHQLVHGTTGRTPRPGLAYALRQVFPTAERHDRALLLLMGGMTAQAAASAANGVTEARASVDDVESVLCGAYFRGAVENLAFTYDPWPGSGWGRRQLLLEALAAPVTVVQQTLDDEIGRLLSIDREGNARKDEPDQIRVRRIRAVEYDPEGDCPRVRWGSPAPLPAVPSKFLRGLDGAEFRPAAVDDAAQLVERVIGSLFSHPPTRFGGWDDLFQEAYEALLKDQAKDQVWAGLDERRRVWRAQKVVHDRLVDLIRRQETANKHEAVINEDEDPFALVFQPYRSPSGKDLDPTARAIAIEVHRRARGLARQIMARAYRAVFRSGKRRRKGIDELRMHPEFARASRQLASLWQCVSAERTGTAVGGAIVVAFNSAAQDRSTHATEPGTSRATSDAATEPQPVPGPSQAPRHVAINDVEKVARSFANRLGSDELADQVITWLGESRQLPLLRDVCRQANGHRGDAFAQLPEVVEILAAIREGRPATKPSRYPTAMAS